MDKKTENGPNMDFEKEDKMQERFVAAIWCADELAVAVQKFISHHGTFDVPQMPHGKSMADALAKYWRITNGAPGTRQAGGIKAETNYAVVPVVPTPAMRDAFLRLTEKGATPSDEDDTEFKINWATAIRAWNEGAK